jgi:hypothetical protein
MNRRLRLLRYTIALGIVGLALAACSSSTTTNETMGAASVGSNAGTLLRTPADLNSQVGVQLGDDLAKFERELGSSQKLITDLAALDKAPATAPVDAEKASKAALEQAQMYHMCGGYYGGDE